MNRGGYIGILFLVGISFLIGLGFFVFMAVNPLKLSSKDLDVVKTEGNSLLSKIHSSFSNRNERVDYRISCSGNETVYCDYITQEPVYREDIFGNKIRNGTLFKISVPFSQIERKEIDADGKEFAFNYVVPNALKLRYGRNEKTISRQTVIDRIEKSKSPVINEFSFVLPLDVEYAKVGENSIRLIQVEGDLVDASRINLSIDNQVFHLDIDESSPYNSLEGYWNFDLDDNTTAYDFSEKRDGTYPATAWTTEGKFSNGVRFNGINQHYIDLGNEESTLNVQEGSYSVVAWVNFTDKSDEANANQDWFFMGDSEPTSTRNGSVMRFNSNSQTVVWVTNWNAPVTSFSSINSGSTTLTHGKWYHIGYTYDVSTGNRTIFVDGVAVASDLDGGTVGHRNDDSGLSSMRIGQGTANRPVNGTIDEVMLFSKTLSNSEVADIYNNQSKRFKKAGLMETEHLDLSSSGYDYINISIDQYDRYLSTNISGRIGQWNLNYSYNETDMNLTADSLLLYSHADNSFNSSVGGRNGTVEGTIEYQGGEFNNSWFFDGNDRIIYDNSDGFLDFDSNKEFTISALVKQNASSINEGCSTSAGGCALLSQTNNDGVGWFVLLFGTALYFYDDSSFNLLQTQIADYDNFAHLVIIRNSTAIFSVTNGEVGSQTTSINPIQVQGDLIVGNQSTWDGSPLGINLYGNIDELMYFNRSLSVEEARELFVRSRANWNFTEYKNFSEGEVQADFNITPDTTHILPSYKLLSDNNQFYTSYLGGIETIFSEFGLEGSPVISEKENPQSPTEYAYFKTYELNATITDVDSDLDTIILEWNSQNYTPSVNADEYNVTFKNIGAGNYTYRWWTNDSKGHVTTTEYKNYTIEKSDNIAGSITFSPAQTVTYPTQTTASAFLDFVVNGDDDVTYQLFRDNTLIAGFSDQATLGAGNYTYIFNSTEGENYTAVQLDIENLTVNKGDPALDITFSPAQSVQTETTTTVSNSSCPSQLVCTFLKLSGVWTLISGDDVQTLAVGIYPYIFNTTGNQNYTASSSQENLTVTNVDSTTIDEGEIQCPEDLAGFYNPNLPHYRPVECGAI